MPSFGSHSMRGFTRFTDRVGEALGRLVIWSTDEEPVAPPLHIRPTAEPTLDGEPGDFYVTLDGELMGWIGDGYGPVAGASDVYDVGNFGATGDGETDDTAAIQAAINACGAAAGGIVVFPPGTYGISSLVAIPQTVALVGSGMLASTVTALHANARLSFTDTTRTNHGDFAFDGNDLATTGIVFPTGSNAGGMRNVLVRDCVGTDGAMRLHAVQNATFDNIEVTSNTSGLWVDDGCGSIVFTALKANDNEYWQLKVGSSGTSPSGYTEPTAITFIAPVLEWIAENATANSVATMVVTGGEHLLLLNPILVAPNNSQTEPALAMATVAPNTVCRMQVIGSIFSGSGGTTDKMMTLGAQSYLHFSGKNAITAATVGVHLSTSSAQLHGDMPSLAGVTTARTFAGGASEGGNVFRVASNQSLFNAASTGSLVEMVTVAGEAGVRFIQYADGTMAWMDGTSFSPDTTAGRQGAAEFGTPINVNLRAGYGGWNDGHIQLGGYHLWVDTTGDLRIKLWAPASDLDGTVVGTQS